MINVKESKTKASRWAKALKWTLPVLLDLDGQVATSYAPAEAAPYLPRYQVPIGSNLLIDRGSRIRFFSLLDSANFDARLLALTARLENLLAET